MKVLILGGNRFFGLHLARELLRQDHEVTLLNRGKVQDDLGHQVERIQSDRKLKDALAAAVKGREWDIVVDQICYTANEAREACEIFGDKAGRYVVTSSESVYDPAQDLKEAAFDPRTYSFQVDASATENYQEAKRQVEVVMTAGPFRQLAIVRPSLVVGGDDYTGRLKWHIDRIRRGQSIYFPNKDIEWDFIRSDQAGEALAQVTLSDFTGPINLTTPGSVPLPQLLDWCEEATGKKTVFAQKAEADNHSPYGGRKTMTMNTEALVTLGVSLEPSREWMKKLVFETAEMGR